MTPGTQSSRDRGGSDGSAATVSFVGFAISFTLRWLTLAPTVTFEDSGELAAAAYTLGVAHAPGYPLFTLLGKLFTLLPTGDVAYRLNLMSAICASLAAALLAATALRILGTRTLSAQAAAVSCSVWLATSLEVWEQSVITEVYALNLLLVALFLWALASWRRSVRQGAPTRALVFACFVSGLAVTAHSISLMLVPLLVLFVAVVDWPRLARLRAWAVGGACFAVGLAPYLYLPMASRFDPPWNWGDPETLAALWRMVTWNLSGAETPRSLVGALDQVGLVAELVGQQWLPPFLLLAVAGLVWLFRRDRAWFALAVAFLLLGGPGVALATNVDVSGPDPAIAAENAAQVSVHFIPLYLCLALLMGLGLDELVRSLPPGRIGRRGLASGFVIVALAASYPNYRNVDMSDYRFAEDYAHDMFTVLAPDSLLFVNWDPFYFPLVYSQIVERRRSDLTVLDRPLLRTSWYVREERRRHPEAFEPASAAVEAFLAAVEPFERGLPHEPRRIQSAYESMIRALVDRSFAAGKEVYFVDRPPPSIAASYFDEPVVVARRLTRDPSALSPIAYDSLRFRGYQAARGRQDRWPRIFGRHYATLLFERASRVEQRSELEPALRLYRQAAALLVAGDPLLERVEAAIVRLGGP